MLVGKKRMAIFKQTYGTKTANELSKPAEVVTTHGSIDFSLDASGAESSEEDERSPLPHEVNVVLLRKAMRYVR